MNKCFCHFNGYEVKDSKARPVTNVSAMKSMNLVEGNTIKTLGYYEPNDGGSGLYIIKERTSEHIEDGGIIHFVGDSLIAELIIKDSLVNIKQIGAIGDGENDDSVYFEKCLGKVRNVFIPAGNYKFSHSVTLAGYDINFFGEMTLSPNVLANERTIITSENEYAFTIGWGNVNNFKNICFEGYGLDTPTSSLIEGCMFRGKIGIKDTRMLQIDKCIFRNIEVGVEHMVDSVLTNCAFNNCSNYCLNMTDSNDNRINNNRFAWSKIGINLNTSKYNVINGNIFDRMSEYGIQIDNCVFNDIISNNFERNLLGHLKGKIYSSNVIGNSFLGKNYEDDQSGEVVPTISLNVDHLKGSVFNSNIIRDSENLFSSSIVIEDTTFTGCIFEGLSIDKKLFNLGKVTVNGNSTSTFRVEWKDFNYLNIPVYDLEILDVVLDNGTKIIHKGDSRITRCEIHRNNGLYIDVKNETTDAIEWTVYVLFGVKNPRKAKSTQ